MINELENKIEEFKGVVEVLPTKTVDQRKKKEKVILDAETEANEQLRIVTDEIKSRLTRFNVYHENPEIANLKKELDNCNIINEWNEYNTPYEKMHLDYYLYQLHKFYKDDLKGINQIIRKILEAFRRVGIELTKADFDYNHHAALYLDMIINNKSEEELINAFEDYYWHVPEIIKIIEINFKGIYIRYEKKIIKYYQDRHQEFLKTHSEQEIKNLKEQLMDKIEYMESVDPYILFNKFKNKEWLLGDFKESDIAKMKYNYFKEGCYSLDSLLKFKYSLLEYKLLLDYSFLLDNMRTRLDNKDSYKGLKANAIKEIQADENKLRKLNASRDRKPLFFKRKNDEKWLFNYNETIKSLLDKYEKYDDICFNDSIYNTLSKDSSVNIIFNFITSNYLYFVFEYKKHDENISLQDITSNFESLKKSLEYIDFSLLTHLALLDEKEIKYLIVNKYNLIGFNLTPETLEAENVDRVIDDIQTLINYEHLSMSPLDINDVKFYDEVEKLNLINNNKEEVTE